MSRASDDDAPQDAAGDGGATAREINELAARYLDLWQDQMSALAADPEFAEAWRKLVESFGAQALAWQAQGLPQGLPQGMPTAGGLPDPMAAIQAMMAGVRPEGVHGAEGRQGGDGTGRKRSAGDRVQAAAGATAAATASGGGGADLEQLAARLERIEKRLAALESKPAAKSGGTRKRNRKSGS